MTDSVKTQILDDIVSTVRGVSAGSTYSRNIRTASRSAKTLPESPIFDVVYVDRTTQRKTFLMDNYTQVELSVWLVCIVEDGSDIGTAVDAIEADVERALSVDKTRGGIAITTKVLSTEEATTEGMEPLGATLIEVQVLYRHTEGNPYSQT